MMTPHYFLHRAIKVMDVIDHTTRPLSTEEYLTALGDDNMMLESVTLEEIVATYLYGLDTPDAMMMEAISTTRNRLPKTMAAFCRALNQQLNGSGIEAGEAELKNPGKSGQIAVMTARLPLSDGQSISVIFHSPSGDAGKITTHDDLVAFRFLLNKRDVTHVVAPSGGQDISLKQTCLSLANLAERNSTKFQNKQAENKAKESELAALQAATEQLQTETADVIEKADTLTAKAADDQKAIIQAQNLLDKQKARNEELRRQLVAKGATPEPSPTTGPKAPEQGRVTAAADESEPAGKPQAAQAPLPQPTDTIRKVKQELNSNGKMTLTNGAEISRKYRGEDGLVGYVTLTEPGGKTYTMKSPSSQGGAMDDTVKALYKAYREGKAEKYLGAVPGTTMTEQEAIALLEAMPYGSKTRSDYADMSAPAEVISTQMGALVRLYGEMDLAITEHPQKWSFGKTTREHLLGQYLQMEEGEAHEIANTLTRGTMPNGDRIMPTRSTNLDAEKLVRGEYSTDEMLNRLIRLGGTYKGAPKEVQISNAKQMLLRAKEDRKTAQDMFDNAKKLGAESAFEKQLYGANKEAEAYERYLADLTATPAQEPPAPEPAVLAEPAAADDQPAAGQLYWYGLRNRPLSLGAQPKGSVAYVEPGDVQTDPRTADMVKAAGENSARHGAVAYDHELTPQEVANYELTDFGRMAAAWNEPRRTAALDELKGTLDTLLGDGMSPGDIWKDLITPNGALVTNNPFYDWDEERYRGDELTKALQEAGYTGTVKNMFNQLVDQQWAAIEQANKSPEELEQERREKARQAGAAALNDLVKGARLPAGWSQEVDLAFGERAAVFVDTPDLPNGDEHEGYLITANANDAGELDGTFNVSSGNGDPIAPSQTDWEEISQAMQADYQKDTTEAEEQTAAKAAPAQEPTQAPGEGGEQPADNQWGETDPEVLALLEQAEQLRTTETDSGKYLADLQRIAADLEQAGAIERHEPYLHSVSDRLTELMEAEGV